MKQKYLITIVGPTAIGKTDLSIKLATHFRTEIISSDSRQFYKELKIGTAVPSLKELSLVRHHFIQNRSIFENYNVGDFENEAVALINRLFLEKDILIMVGGSGLYVDAVTKGLDDFPKVDPVIREQLKLELQEKGIESLQKKLEDLDPKTYHRMDVFNKQRLIRALEISIGTEHPYSYYLSKSDKKREFQNIKIGLRADREITYQRINQRVDLMISEGLVEEAEKVYPHRELNALQTVGYKELFAYFDGHFKLDEAISEIKKNTRRFAKRQGTWFRKDKQIEWFDYKTDIEKVIAYIEKCISNTNENN